MLGGTCCRDDIPADALKLVSTSEACLAWADSPKYDCSERKTSGGAASGVGTSANRAAAIAPIVIATTCSGTSSVD